MVYMLLVIAIVILGTAVFLGVGALRTRAGASGRRFETVAGPIQGLVEPVATLPPVLLPAQPVSTDVEAVRFSLALRGYRCDQVDEVLEALSTEISRLHEVIAERVDDPVISNTSNSSE